MSKHDSETSARRPPARRPLSGPAVVWLRSQSWRRPSPPVRSDPPIIVRRRPPCSRSISTVFRFTAEAPPAAWWAQFGDPVLADLEVRALAGNLDLHAALARVRSARAAFRQAQYDFAPHVPLDGSYSRSKEQQPGFTTDRIDIENASIGFDASWEIDLFGRVRHATAAARAAVGEQQADLADARIIVAAEVARNYFELRGAQRQIAVALDNLRNEREALRLTQIRYDAGRVTELDTDSAQARLKATESTLPPLQAAEKRYGYRLAVLLGASPGTLDAQLAAAPVRVMTAPPADRRRVDAAAHATRRARRGTQSRRSHGTRRSGHRGSIPASQLQRLRRLPVGGYLAAGQGREPCVAGQSRS